MFKPKKAFTLIELLVVIAIIGILATISVIALQNARAKSRDAKRIADVKQVQTALELYFNDMNRYPLTEEFTSAGLFSTSSEGTTTYMTRVPSAATPADGNCSASDNSFYYTSDDGSTYTLSFCVGGNTGSLSAGINTLSPGGIAYGGAGTGGGGGESCSCVRSSLPCCEGCNPANAICQGGDHCARDANCPVGQGCSTGGTCVSFTCGNPVTVGSVGSHTCNEGSPDSDECHYDTVKIGNQCWMKQNIRMAMPGRMYFSWTWSYALTYGDLYYWNGALQLPAKCLSLTDYDCTTDPTVCNSSDNDCDFSLVNPQGVCPAGWHVPTKNDWYALETALGGAGVAGGKMKATATSTTPWDGTNDSGFSALPGGALIWNGYWEAMGWWTGFHASSPYWSMGLSSGSTASSVGYASDYIPYRGSGFHVRCIQD